ncbi:MAG TPA: hypothetical protein VGA53_04345 [Candidatus Paceibacterota bacterium]
MDKEKDLKIEEIENHLKEKHGLDEVGVDREIHIQRKGFEKIIQSVVNTYISKARAADKSIEELTPWQLLNAMRSPFIRGKSGEVFFTDDYGYSTSQEAQTVGLLIIERELSAQYGEAYKKYSEAYPEEQKANESLEKSMKKYYTSGLFEGKKREEIDREQELKFWMAVINQRDPWKGVRVERQRGGAFAATRSEEEIRERIDKAIEAYL